MANLSQTTAQIQAILDNGIINPMTDTGDLIVGAGNAPTRLARGTRGQALTINSGATGLEWTGGGGGGGSATIIEVSCTGDPFNSSSSDPISWMLNDPSYTSMSDIYTAATNGMLVLHFTLTSYGTADYYLPLADYYYDNSTGNQYSVTFIYYGGYSNLRVTMYGDSYITIESSATL